MLRREAAAAGMTKEQALSSLRTALLAHVHTYIRAYLQWGHIGPAELLPLRHGLRRAHEHGAVGQKDAACVGEAGVVEEGGDGVEAAEAGVD